MMMKQGRGNGRAGCLYPVCGGEVESVDAGLLGDCLARARELLDLLREEEKILLAFQGERLLEILPRKEALAGELDTGLRAMRSRALPVNVSKGAEGSQDVGMEERGVPTSSDGALSALKECLTEILTLNRRNHVFIQCSLSYWEEMLGLFLPAAYGGGETKRWEAQGFGARGLAINKEV